MGRQFGPGRAIVIARGEVPKLAVFIAFFAYMAMPGPKSI